jgi:hypothetical protein
VPAGAPNHDLGTEGSEDFDEKLAEKIEDDHSSTMMALVLKRRKTGNR